MRPTLTLLTVLGLALLAPSLAPAASYSELRPNDPRTFTWIEEGVLGLGGGGLSHADVDTVYDLGFRAIANFRAEHEDPADHIRARGMEYLYLPVDHAVDMNATQLQQLVDWLRAQRDAGRPAYIHCTNGWHRAAAFSAAWLMAEHGMGADEAFERVRDLRGPWAVNRAPAALLAYEAQLRGETPLNVLLLSPVARPEHNETMPVVVEVTYKGRPVADAKVHVWSEESKMDLWGDTDANGRFEFTYTAPGAHMAVDHLYARASADGRMDGADNVELFFKLRVPTTRPLEIEARLVPEGVEVRVTRNGQETPARVMATGDDGAYAFDATRSGITLLRMDHDWMPVDVRAEQWGTLGGSLRVEPPPPAVSDGRGLEEVAQPPWDVPPAQERAVEQPPENEAPPPRQDAAPDAVDEPPQARETSGVLIALGALGFVALAGGAYAATRRLGAR